MYLDFSCREPDKSLFFLAYPSLKRIQMKKRDVIDIAEKQKGENTLVLQRIVL
ncbi:hypothetical protein ACIN8IBEIGE_20128 [Acinetobacter sp. 8I-beige]|nr:hypothetical protein ACIN8IBEIGE_20128 [Acinetobacter sp. 8I-beige]